MYGGHPAELPLNITVLQRASLHRCLIKVREPCKSGRSKVPWLHLSRQPLTNLKRQRRYKWPSVVSSLKLLTMEKTDGHVSLSQLQWEQLLRHWQCTGTVLGWLCKHLWPSRWTFRSLWLSQALSWPPGGTQAMPLLYKMHCQCLLLETCRQLKAPLALVLFWAVVGQTGDGCPVQGSTGTVAQVGIA